MDPSANFVADIAVPNIPHPLNVAVAANSCANIDVGKELSAVTKWFVAVFSGFANAGNAFVVPQNFDGFPETKAIHANAIIRFDRLRHGHDKAHKTTCKNALCLSCPTAEACFWNAFRRVASNPIGRVLLYRILLEIFRPTEALDALVLHPGIIVNLPARNAAKTLLIRYSRDPNNAWFDPNGIFMFSNRLSPITLLKRIHNRRNNYEICVGEDAIANTVTTTIFHEFLHWFHFLRCQSRMANYRIGYAANMAAPPAAPPPLFLSAHSVTHVLYGFPVPVLVPPLPIATINSQLPWNNGAGQCNYEEILTIIGRDIAAPMAAEYLVGDDLSENAYRMSVRLPHRFGHAGFIFLEGVFVLNYSTNVAENCVTSITNPVAALVAAGGIAISPMTRYLGSAAFSARGLVNAGIGNSWFP
ncbi:MAG: hypothetical protein LBD81_03425 [Holosporaceae bacterium]|jgi:hypothetical protein|nr:hypothetical protein [Holosporaceae bacterium]